MADTANQIRGTPGRLRASDADRDRVAHLLSDALVEGRLSEEEHADRINAVYAATMVDEFAALTHDLPYGDPVGNSTQPVRRTGPVAACASDQELLDTGTGSENIMAVLATTERQGRWLVEPRTNTSSVFGSITLDLCGAVLARQEVTVQCALFCSRIRIVVPPDVRVMIDSPALHRSVNLDGRSATRDGGPTLHLAGAAMMSGIEITTGID